MLLSKLSYLGSMSAPGLYLLFALEFARSAPVARPATLALLWVVPAAGVVLAFTNEMHRLVWIPFTPGRPGTHLLVYRHGPAYFVLVAYLYAVLAVGTVVLLRQALRGRVLHRRQALAILVGVPLPLLANVLYVTGTSPIPELDLAPAAFALTGLALAMGLYRLRLFDLIRVARDLVIDGMADGVLVLDEAGRVLDVNPAGRAFLEGTGSLTLGEMLPEPAAAWLATVRSASSEVGTEAAVVASGRVVDARIAPLRGGRGRGAGQLLVLRAVTEARRASEAEPERRGSVRRHFPLTGETVTSPLPVSTSILIRPSPRR